jgi:single-stranded DNA-binding protein
MSLHILVSGSLVADPVRRTSAAGKTFATGSLRVATDDDSILVSLIGFSDAAESLLAHSVGASIAVSGRAKMTTWTGRDGSEKHGLSVVIEQIASASSARRADADRRRERHHAA